MSEISIQCRLGSMVYGIQIDKYEGVDLHSRVLAFRQLFKTKIGLDVDCSTYERGKKRRREGGMLLREVNGTQYML